MKVALICCGRLENRYAVEFVEHYKQLGFDHIYICDNNHDDEEHFEDVLQPYIDEDFVTIINYRNVICIQWFVYKHVYDILSYYDYKYDWLFCCDFDEFLTLTKDKNIKEYLSRDCFKDANQILINWKTYTDNDLVYDDGRPCLERFTEQNKSLFNCYYVKCFIKGYQNQIYMHTPHFFYNDELNNTTYNNCGIKCKCESYQDINYDLSYIKHFQTKTIDEYLNNKLKRGTGDRSYEHFKMSYDFNTFFIINKKTKEKLDYLKNHNINIDNLNL